VLVLIVGVGEGNGSSPPNCASPRIGHAKKPTSRIAPAIRAGRLSFQCIHSSSFGFLLTYFVFTPCVTIKPNYISLRLCDVERVADSASTITVRLLWPTVQIRQRNGEGRGELTFGKLQVLECLHNPANFRIGLKKNMAILLRKMPQAKTHSPAGTCEAHERKHERAAATVLP
jgi:hypothetical protein